MEQLTLPKASLPSVLNALCGDYRVIVPRRVGPADVVFDDFVADEAIPFDYVNAHLPPKSFFFPQRECLLTISGGKRPSLLPPPAEKPVAIFGLRSCDATALVYLSRFFGERGFEDDLVMNKIRGALRMTLSCHSPGPDCFCVCCDGGPFLASGFDIQFTDLGETLLAEVATEKGAAVLAKGSGLFNRASEEDLAAKARQVGKVDQMFRRRSFMADGVKRISLDKIPAETWEKWAKGCQGCGGCCYLCPTCSCFTVSDTWRTDDEYARERTWDTCLYEGFTREASGHNPRAALAERLKRRFFHKLSYQYMELMGRLGCVGCGRCVSACMGGPDVPDLLARIQDECK